MENRDCSRILNEVTKSNRWKIVACLLTGAMSVGELQECLGVEQSLLSHHLKKLKDLKIVESRRKGRKVYYTLKGYNPAKNKKQLDLGCCQLTFQEQEIQKACHL